MNAAGDSKLRVGGIAVGELTVALERCLAMFQDKQPGRVAAAMKSSTPRSTPPNS